MAWENVRPHSLLQQRWKLRCQEVQLRTTQEPEQTEQQGWTRTQGSPVVVQCISPPTGPSPEAWGDVASTPALCGDPLGNAYQQARPTGVCWCWRQKAQDSGLGAESAVSESWTWTRDRALAGGCGRNVRGRDRGCTDSEHPQAGQLRGQKTCVVTQTPHRGGSVCTLMLCCCHLQIPNKFLNMGSHIFFTQAPVNCVVSFAHVTESRAQARLSRPQ